MDLFADYDREFSRITENCRNDLGDISSNPNLYGESKKHAIRDVERQLEEADRLLQQMELAQRKNPEGSLTMQSALRRHQNTLQELKRAYNKERAAGNDARNELFAGNGGGGDLEYKYKDQRSRIVNNYDKLDKTGDKLERTIDVMNETENMGQDGLIMLKDQRQQLEDANDNMDGINAKMKQASKIVSQMGRRAITNKLILIGIVVLELITIMSIIYFKWLRN